MNAEQCRMLVGIITNGASANIAAAGLKGLIESEVPCSVRDRLRYY